MHTVNTMSAREFKHRILVVDDDEGMLATTAALLSQEGYVVETAREGFEALALLRDIMPEVLVSDLKMPNMSGFELLAVVRKRFPAIAVIARSSEFSPVGLPEGVIADRYVPKGVNDNFDLVEAVRELLSVWPLRTQPPKPDNAPVWLPRSGKGYVVITCPSCLRSFSLLRKIIESGSVMNDDCIHCGLKLSYRIDSTTSGDSDIHRLESGRLTVDANRKRIADSRRTIADSQRTGGMATQEEHPPTVVTPMEAQGRKTTACASTEVACRIRLPRHSN